MSHYLLYLNFWGTTAKLLEGKELSPPADVEVCQRHFRKVLSRLAKNQPTISIVQQADEAYVVGPEFNALVDAAADVFVELMQFENAYRFWPLRGAIGRSAKLDRLDGSEDGAADSSSNFHSTCFFGSGAVEVARLEKSAQKGARLFFASDLINELEGGRLPTRERSTRGLEHHEVNWLTRAPQLHNFLTAKASELIELETNYSLQMAGSLLDLIKWSNGATEIAAKG